ncbi:MAG: hypothetical protein Fur0034_04920 [Desulfuromonadia bacterium]
MKRFDRFDLFLVSVMVLSLISLPVVRPVRTDTESSATSSERLIAARSRLLFIQTTFRPVEDAIAAGKLEEGGLLLEELFRIYPGESYGLLLKGRILARRGALPEALGAYGEAVRRDGSLVDRRGLFSARGEIEGVVARAEGSIPLEARRRNHDLGYLKSRLAGGCE